MNKSNTTVKTILTKQGNTFIELITTIAVLTLVASVLQIVLASNYEHLHRINTVNSLEFHTLVSRIETDLKEVKDLEIQPNSLRYTTRNKQKTVYLFSSKVISRYSNGDYAVHLTKVQSLQFKYEHYFITITVTDLTGHTQTARILYGDLHERT